MDNNDKLNGCCVRAKRRRTANYTHVEKQILLNLVRKYLHIIEKKKSDSATCREKEVCWKQITDTFNAQGINMHRSTESLKKWFENQKKRARRIMSQQKLNGKACGENDFMNYLMISDETQTFSISSDDGVLADDSLLDSSADIVAIKRENDEFDELVIEENDINDFKDENVQSDKDSYILVTEEESSQSQPPNQDYLLQETKKLDKLKPWPHRKRVFASDFNSLCKHYHKRLYNVKLKIAQNQLKTLEATLKTKEEQEKLERELKMKSLQLDIDIKQEFLNKIKLAKPSECLQNLLQANFVTNSNSV